MAKWLDKYEQGGLVLKKKTKDNYGKKPNVNDVKVSAGPGFEGDGYTAQNWKSPAWGGQFAMGGALPGAVGFTYARTAGSAPANGKYAKKTKASAQDGKALSPDADDRSTLGFNTSDPAFQNVKSNAFVPFDKKDFEGIRQNMAGYMSSPLYMERLSKSIPDAENAKEIQKRRLDNLLSIKLNPKTVSEGSHYDRNQHRVNLGATDFIDNAVISHEIAHGTVPNLTTTYGKQNIFGKAASVVGDLFQPYEQFSNSELEKINVPLSGKITAPNFDYMMARKEEHYKPQGTKASAKTAANETYGDLTGMRQLLLDNGVTTEFGQELTPELFKKATENKRVINSPAFKRMKLKFKDEDIIKMNNEVAMNDNKKDIPQAQLGVQLMPYLLSSAASVAASIPTMEEVKKKAINVIKNSPKLRSALNSGLSYVANTDWGKEKLKNLANNIDPHGYGLGYERAAGKSPVERIYSAAILNKKEDSRKEMDSLLAAGQAYPDDSLRVDLMNQYAGLPQKYNTLKASAYKPTMGDKNQKYFNSPILDKHVLDDIDVISRGNKVKPEFKTKKDLENFVANYLGGKKQDPKYPDDPTKSIPDKGKGSNYLSILSGLGEITYGIGEDEKGHYLSYYDNWDLNPYSGMYSLPEDSYYKDINTTNDNLARSIIGNNKENNATKRIGTPTNIYNRIYFDKKTGKPKMKKGGVIKDDRGQWAHPGEITEIGSNDITMQGVDYPVLGISDTGDTQMMYPDQDYKFDGEKVTEFPMAQNGKWLNKYATEPKMLSDATRDIRFEQSNRAKLDQYYKSIDPANQPSISQWNPKPGEVEAQNAREAERLKDENSWVSKFSRNPHVIKGTKNLGDAGMFAIDAMTLGEGALALNTIAKPIIKAATKKAATIASKAAKSATKASSSNYVKDLYYSGKSYATEIAGEQLAGAENRKAIAEGNKWFEDWANHPETARKIKQQIIDQKTLGKNNPEIFDRIDTPETMQDYRYLTTYKPGAAEYPLADQTKDLIKTILGNNKYRTPMVHGDNFGVSYRHGMSKWSNMDDYIPGDRFSGPGTWISRTPAMDQAARKSITIHENAHDWLRSDALERLGFKDEIQKHLTKEAIDSKAKFIKSGYNFRENYLGYLAHETEVLSRVMETRLHFGLTPTDKVTSEMAESMLQVIREGKTPINKQFADIFSSPKGAAKLFNKLPAIAPVAVGVGAAATTLPKEQKNGGWLNKYK
jgi:hypothetical protein